MEYYLHEIIDINTHYLVLAKNMIDEDRHIAAFRLGISFEIADRIASLSINDLLKIAKINQLLFNFRFKNITEINALMKSSRIEKLKPMHAGIILSSNFLK